MKNNSLIHPNPANEPIEFHFVSFLRDLDRRMARDATNELNRHFVRNLTRERLARAH